MRAKISNILHPYTPRLGAAYSMPASSQKYCQDRVPPFSTRVYLQDYAGLDPLVLPWDELRRDPDKFPQWDVAKVSSVRTVVGLDYTLPGGGVERIYLKRSILLGSIKQFLSRFRASKEWREFQHAEEFTRAGVRVPMPVYYAEGMHNHEPVVFYATKAFDSRWRVAKTFFKSTRHFGKEWQELAHYTKWLHAQQILHGDFRSDHIYFDEKALAEGSDLAWALMDLDGSCVGQPLLEKDRFRALTQLTESLLTSGIERGHIAEFLDIYDPEHRFRLDADKIYEFIIDKVRNKALDEM